MPSTESIDNTLQMIPEVPLKPQSNISHIFRYIKYIPFYTLSWIITYIIIFFEIPIYTPTYMSLILDTDIESSQQVYRWFTYSLLHINLTHLLINCIMFLIYSTFIEIDNNILRHFLIHFLSILGGAFGVGWENRLVHNARQVVGASGGLYGLIASQVGNLIINWPEFNLFRRVIYLISLLTVIITDATLTILAYDDNVSYSTHFGGFIMGALAGGALMHNIRKLNWERKFRYSCWVGVAILVISGSINLYLP